MSNCLVRQCLGESVWVINCLVRQCLGESVWVSNSLGEQPPSGFFVGSSLHGTAARLNPCTRPEAAHRPSWPRDIWVRLFARMCLAFVRARMPAVVPQAWTANRRRGAPAIAGQAGVT